MTKQASPYEDIIHLPHHSSSSHPPMPLRDRAAQFAPFAALTGYDAAVLEAARLTESRIELDESRKAALSRRLELVREHIREQPEITVVFFQPDGKKSGGAYRTAVGSVKKLDEHEKKLLLADGTAIAIEDIYDMESDLFKILDGESETWN